MEKEVEIARQVAREAGRILMDYYREGAEVKWKGHDDPVTAADHAANEFLVRELARRFPEDAILSEELPDNQERLHNDRVWMIDPMDGTKQFIERIGEFAVMIGLAVKGRAELGVVYHPSLDRMYYAAPGMGAFLEEKLTTRRLQVSKLSDPAQMIAAMSRSHHNPKVDLVLDRLGIRQRMSSGSVGLKIGLIAENRAQVYLHLGSRTNLWDTCGPEAILRHAGGIVTNLHGEALDYSRPEIRNQQGVVASNHAMHEKFIEAIASLRS